jgi:putative flavoprotein involved in K+ transport
MGSLPRSRVRDEPAVVIGAGSSGLSVAGALRRAGIASIVFDQESVLGAAWRKRYDSLSLNTSRPLSRLAGYRPMLGPGHWMSRDAFIDYLERYATDLELQLELETKVTKISREGRSWRLDTSRGTVVSRTVVVATGPDAVPVIPPWSGLARFSGDFLHSHEYRNADAYRGKNILVVGAGDTAADIVLDAVEAGASRVQMSIRTPPFIVKALKHGIPPDWLALVGRQLPPHSEMPSRLA